MSRRVFTSTKTRVLPSFATRSISPARVRTLRSRIAKPLRARKRAASSSPLSPVTFRVSVGTGTTPYASASIHCSSVRENRVSWLQIPAKVRRCRGQGPPRPRAARRSPGAQALSRPEPPQRELPPPPSHLPPRPAGAAGGRPRRGRRAASPPAARRRSRGGTGLPAPRPGLARVLARGRDHRDALLLEPRRLADQVAEVVELRPPHGGPLHHLDLVDPRRVHRERALHPDPVGDAAHRERGPGAAPAPADHHAPEGLQPLLLTLDDLDHHLDGVPGLEAAPVLLEIARLDDSDRCQDLTLLAR